MRESNSERKKETKIQPIRKKKTGYGENEEENEKLDRNDKERQRSLI